MLNLRHVLRAVTPLWLRNAFRDLIERAYWHAAGKATALSNHGLTRTQIYPYGRNFLPVLSEATRGKLSGLSLTPTTPVASIGTLSTPGSKEFSRR